MLQGWCSTHSMHAPLQSGAPGSYSRGPMSIMQPRSSSACATRTFSAGRYGLVKRAQGGCCKRKVRLGGAPPAMPRSLGIWRYSGVCPPWKPGRLPAPVPERDFCPRMPKPQLPPCAIGNRPTDCISHMPELACARNLPLRRSVRSIFNNPLLQHRERRQECQSAAHSGTGGDLPAPRHSPCLSALACAWSRAAGIGCSAAAALAAAPRTPLLRPLCWLLLL